MRQESANGGANKRKKWRRKGPHDEVCRQCFDDFHGSAVSCPVLPRRSSTGFRTLSASFRTLRRLRRLPLNWRNTGCRSLRSTCRPAIGKRGSADWRFFPAVMTISAVRLRKGCAMRSRLARRVFIAWLEWFRPICRGNGRKKYTCAAWMRRPLRSASTV